MHHILAELVAALGLAVGLTAFTTLTLRSETLRFQTALTFLLMTTLVLVLLAFVELPESVDMILGATGFVIGAFAFAGLAIARRVERKMQAPPPPRGAGGMKIVR